MVVTAVPHRYQPTGCSAEEPTTPKVKAKVVKKSSSFKDEDEHHHLQEQPSLLLPDLTHQESGLPQSQSFKDVVEEMTGVSLFSCGNMEFFRSSIPPTTAANALFDSLADELNVEDSMDYYHDDGSDDDDFYPQVINMKPESPNELTSCPRILTTDMMQQLLDQGLPSPLRMAQWDRIYAVGRDGDALLTMQRHCRDYKDTVIVVQTAQGHVLGGFASSSWTKQEGSRARSYFGTGETFLFASHPETTSLQEEQDYKEQDQKPPLTIYKWTGRNTYSQVFDGDMIAMGGEGAFGLCIQNDFSRGSTGYCSTFGNPPLTPGGHFEVTSFEVYGFASLGATLSSTCASSSMSPSREYVSSYVDQASYNQR